MRLDGFRETGPLVLSRTTDGRAILRQVACLTSFKMRGQFWEFGAVGLVHSMCSVVCCGKWLEHGAWC